MGECGTPVSGEDFVREPVKVLENVQMVWVDRMCFNSPEQEIPEIWHYNTTYDFNMFVRMKDGTFMAAGKGLGDKETKTVITGDLSQDQTHRYSDTFVPVRIKKYSEADDRTSLCRLEWGMRGEEVEEMTGPLEYTQEEGRVSWAAEPENGNYYGFFFYDGKVTSILECEEKTGFVEEPGIE